MVGITRPAVTVVPEASVAETGRSRIREVTAGCQSAKFIELNGRENPVVRRQHLIEGVGKGEAVDPDPHAVVIVDQFIERPWKIISIGMLEWRMGSDHRKLVSVVISFR